MQRGFCKHPDKNCRIVTEWKCVDIRFPDKLPMEEVTKRRNECRVKDWYGVCPLCKHFTPEATSQPTAPPATANKPSAYIAEKPATATPNGVDIDMDEFI
jgi:hypothetical protein